jgi:hypothetical protein
MPAPSDILAERVTLRLRSIDRLYLNLYVPTLQTAPQVTHFLLAARGFGIASPAAFGQMTNDWVQRVERLAADEGVPLIRFERGERKEERVRPLFERAGAREGLVCIGVAQERASSWWGRREHADPKRRFSFQRRTVSVNHVYFYLADRAWGPAFIKVCSYAPFAGKVWLNAHSWLKRGLAARGIGFTELDNGLLACSDPSAAQRLAEALVLRDIEAFLARWLARIPLPLSTADRAAGYRYQASLLQLEASETFVFERPLDGRLFFEAAIRQHLDLGRPDEVALIFHRRIRRNTPSEFRTRVITDGVDPSIVIQYRRSKAKAYFKDGRALRIETTINDTRDLGIGRSLARFAEVRAEAFAINDRFLAALRARALALVPAADLERICLPSRDPAGHRAPALRFADPRVVALWSALCAFALLPLGFTNQRLRPLVADLLGAPPAEYTARRMSYDLRRLLRKGVIARLPGTHRYVVTEKGRALALLFTVTYRRIAIPALGEINDASAPTPLARRWRALARELDRFIERSAVAA